MLKKRDFSWVLAALLVFLIVVPIVEDSGLVSAPVMRVLKFAWLLMFGVWSLRGFGRFFPIGMGLAVIGTLLSVLAYDQPPGLYYYGSILALFGFVMIAVWCIGKQVVFSNEISANRVVGAVSLYLLLGVVWAIIYGVIEMLDPGSFEGISEPLSQAWSSDWYYFSFVTMTTLGYGDITPLSATAKAFTYMQAAFGQFYIAILVAGLVSAYISGRQRL
jgi:hypothetical protein